jgi:hypothetical protein
MNITDEISVGRLGFDRPDGTLSRVFWLYNKGVVAFLVRFRIVLCRDVHTFNSTVMYMGIAFFYFTCNY